MQSMCLDSKTYGYYSLKTLFVVYLTGNAYTNGGIHTCISIYHGANIDCVVHHVNKYRVGPIVIVNM